MPSLSTCHLCSLERELRDSHIIPRSYFRNLKDNEGQLFVVNRSLDSGLVNSKLSNADPKEKLLCWECEQYINCNFEQYGTRLFKNHKKVKRAKDIVIFNEFRFKEFYLFLISILWRVSISSLPRYKHIDLGQSINDLFRYCIKENQIQFHSSFRLDHFIRISVIRVIDNSNRIDDKILKKIFFDFNYEKGELASEGMIWYFMVDAFLIIYNFSPEDDISKVRTNRVFAQITDKQTLRVPISDISNFKQLVDGLNSISKQTIEYKKQQLNKVKNFRYARTR